MAHLVWGRPEPDSSAEGGSDNTSAERFMSAFRGEQDNIVYVADSSSSAEFNHSSENSHWKSSPSSRQTDVRRKALESLEEEPPSAIPVRRGWLPEGSSPMTTDTNHEFDTDSEVNFDTDFEDAEYRNEMPRTAVIGTASDVFDSLTAEDKAAVRNLLSEASSADRASGWSVGSARHFQKKCRPCHYINTTVGCTNGEDCTFCHLPHERRNRPRPCRSKRAQCKKIVDMLEVVQTSDPDKFQSVVETLPNRSQYLQTLYQKKVRSKAISEANIPKAKTRAETTSAGPAAPKSGRLLMSL